MNVDFSPKKVYRCDCLGDAIASCVTKKTYSYKDICEEVNKIDCAKIDEGKVYCVKCGENNEDIVISCIDHLSMGIFCVQLNTNVPVILLQTKNSCLTCIRKYLLENYYIFKHVTFKED